MKILEKKFLQICTVLAKSNNATIILPVPGPQAAAKMAIGLILRSG